MAIELDTTASTTAASVTTNEIKITTSAAKRLVVLASNTIAGTTAIEKVTASGLTFTKVSSESKTSSAGVLELWAAYASAKLSEETITVTYKASVTRSTLAIATYANTLETVATAIKLEGPALITAKTSQKIELNESTRPPAYGCCVWAFNTTETVSSGATVKSLVDVQTNASGVDTLFIGRSEATQKTPLELLKFEYKWGTSVASLIIAYDVYPITLEAALAATDKAKITESNSVTRGKELTDTDTAVITETPVAVHSESRQITDTAVITETPVRALTLARATTDTAKISETPETEHGKSVATTDTLKITETPARSALALPRAATDHVTIVDTASRSAVTISRASSDTVTLTELIARAVQLARSASDASTLTESATRSSIGHTVTAADIVQITERPVFEKIITRTAFDIAFLSEFGILVGKPIYAEVTVTATPVYAATVSAVAETKAVVSCSL